MIEFQNVSLEVGEQNEKIDIVKDINLKLENNKIYVITGLMVVENHHYASL
jgi:Fe-S cluster assembly ATP-binding protein